MTCVVSMSTEYLTLFHFFPSFYPSLVGLAAAFTAVGDFMVADPSHASTFHSLST